MRGDAGREALTLRLDTPIATTLRQRHAGDKAGDKENHHSQAREQPHFPVH
jgi:hypothetical protein